MDAVFHIKGNEFAENLFRQIKALLMSNKSLEVTIAIGEAGSKGILRKQTREEYFIRLDKAIGNLNAGKGICLQ